MAWKHFAVVGRMRFIGCSLSSVLPFLISFCLGCVGETHEYTNYQSYHDDPTWTQYSVGSLCSVAQWCTNEAVCPDTILPSRSKGSVWTTEELSELQSKMPNALEARDMHKAYARLSSTLSIDDVLRGIDALEQSQCPLTQTQHRSLQTTIAELTSDHQEMQKVQRD